MRPPPVAPSGRARGPRLVGRGRSGSSARPDQPAAAGVARGTRVPVVPTRLPARAASCAHGPRADIGDARTRCLLVVVLSDRSLLVDGSNNLGLLSFVRARRRERQTLGARDRRLQTNAASEPAGPVLRSGLRFYAQRSTRVPRGQLEMFMKR